MQIVTNEEISSYDWIVVGAGISGATIAWNIASELKKSVLVIEQRAHIAGNLYDEYNTYGVLEHKYGPHIFHTNDQVVWDFLHRFTEWNRYTHYVEAMIDGQQVPIPFNLNSIDQLFSSDLAGRFKEKLIRAYGFGSSVPIMKMMNSSDKDVRCLADYVYKKVFEGYTTKQWGVRPQGLSPTVTARVPIRISRDNRYFQDIHQGIPKAGYTAMIHKMLSHQNIDVMLKTSWRDIRGSRNGRRIVFTGAIDEFFEFKHGELPYRSLRFKPVTLHKPKHQTVATINFPNEHDYTRITEFTHLSGQDLEFTTLLFEFPQRYISGKTIPCYPIPAESNQEMFLKYAREAKGLAEDVFFTGRLADYAYYDMDRAVAAALEKFREISSSPSVLHAGGYAEQTK